VDNLAIDPSRPRNTYCLTDKIPKVCYTFIYFANNQLSPRSISFSLLPTNHPRLLQQSRVRSSQVLLQSCSTCSWVDHAVSGPIMIYFMGAGGWYPPLPPRLHCGFPRISLSLANPLYKRYAVLFQLLRCARFSDLFHMFFELLFNFPSRYFFSIGVCQYLALDVWFTFLQTSS